MGLTVMIDVDLNHLAYSAPLRCVLTGEQLDGPSPVVLRRMYFLGGLWIGESAVVPMPIRSVSYARFQYLRCFGWVAILMSPIPIVANLELSLDYQWVKPTVSLIMMVVVATMVLWALSRERIRLLRVGKDRSKLRVKISDDLWERLEPQVASGISKVVP